MAFISDNYSIYLTEVLNYPIAQRCGELNLLFERCSTKDLQDFFPILVNSIFTSQSGQQIGWGLRTVTRQIYQCEFDILYNFFIPLGPMFRLCYRLLNEPIKFDVPIEILPKRMAEMLYTNRYTQFYADMINIDPVRREIISLSMNSFDYFILHFVLHGLYPIHRYHPAALAVHNEKWQTLYFCLTAEYACWFLPSSPDAIVAPQNICGSVKIATMMPIPQIQPQRSPKYLKMSAISHSFTSGGGGGIGGSGGGTGPNATMNNLTASSSSSPTGQQNSLRNTTTSATGESSIRSYSWRTESVLYLFIDAWLRLDVDEKHDLPSSEFIRVVRVLVKQLHAFANSADLDISSMAPLRRITHPLMNSQIYDFLKCIIKRWPLDSSFSVVLELWLSYIQPWRYTFERNFSDASMAQTQIEQYSHNLRNYEQFIKENMISYTQIFCQLLPRFQRLDFSSFKNVHMFYRVLKVFGQSNLVDILRANEFDVYNNRIFISSASPKHQQHNHQQQPHSHSQSITNHHTTHNNTTGNHTSWVAGGSYRAINENILQDDNYCCLFGLEVKQQMYEIIEKMIITQEIEIERFTRIEHEYRLKNRGLWFYLKSFFSSEEYLRHQQSINEYNKITDHLGKMLEISSIIFEIELPDSTEVAARSAQYSWDDNDRFDMSLSFQSNNNDSTMSSKSFSSSAGGGGGLSSPLMMRRRKFNELNYNVDPALIPVRSSEVTWLVRFLHQFSSKLNLMYPVEITEFWHRRDFLGRLCRQIFYPPMTVHSFDKSHGVSVACEEHLPPRITLRILASYKSIFYIGISLIIGQLWFGVPSFGLFILIALSICYLFIMSMFKDCLTNE